MSSLEIHVPISPNARFYNMVHGFAASLRKNGGRWSGARIIVSVGDDCESFDIEAAHPELAGYGITWRWTDRELYRKYTYFATGLRRWSEPFTSDYVLMADADMLVLGDFSDAASTLTAPLSIAGVIATFPPFMARGDGNTDARRWQELFAAAGLGEAPMRWRHPGAGHLYSSEEGIEEAPPYYNFGFVLGTRDAMNAIAGTFEADYYCALGYMNTDLSAQAGLALSIVRNGIAAHALPVRYNFWNISEYFKAFPEEAPDIRVLHYLHPEVFAKNRHIESLEAIESWMSGADLAHPVARTMVSAFSELLPRMRADVQAAPPLPVARPLLPKSDALSPYLQKIDAARVYSNFGPLNADLEHRLAARAGRNAGSCVTGANATLMLSAALRAVARPDASLCLLPSWTFCASAHAICGAGLTPCFADIDLASWQLTPEIAEDAMGRFGPLAAVMVVAPFGRPIDQEPWKAFHARTGVPVIIDAASAFDAQETGSIPVVVSLHPTKSLAAGEGAFLICDRPDVVDAVRARLNFGFPGRRVSQVASFNGKMSEYAAALALAALEDWPAARDAWKRRRDLYVDRLHAVAGADIFSGDAISSTLVITVPSRDQVAGALQSRGIDTRLWWNLGCHAEPAFAACLRAALPNTDAVAQTYLGLPFSIDMTREQIVRVTDAITAAVAT